MNQFIRWLLVVGLVLGLSGLAWQFWPSEEKRIRKVILGLADDANFSGKEGNFAKVAKIGSFAKQFTETAEVVVDKVAPIDAGLRGRESIRQAFTAVVPLLGAVTVQVHDLNVVVTDATTATAQMTASLKSGGQKAEFNAQEFELKLVKHEGRWLVDRVEAVISYRKPVIQ